MFRMAVQSQLWSGLQLKDMMDRIEEGTKLDIGPSNKQVGAETGSNLKFLRNILSGFRCITI